MRRALSFLCALALSACATAGDGPQVAVTDEPTPIAIAHEVCSQHGFVFGTPAFADCIKGCMQGQ
jgi:hypothetical protein